MTARPSTLEINVRANLQTATVEAVDAEGSVTVALPDGPATAQLAVAGGYEPAPGDTVLVASDNADRVFLIGVLKVRETPRRVATADGVAATIEMDHGAEVMRVRDRSARLILEHRVADSVTVLHAAGDLELRADAGSIRMVARDAVEVRSGTVRVATTDATLEARTITATADKLRQVVGVLETNAGRILERAKNVYRDVEELAQTRAGRIKLVAEKTFHVLGQRALVKAKEDVKIKGEKIYLA